MGSLPHLDPLEAATTVLERLHDVPHLPELPRRGRGADAIGRTAALLVDLPVEVAGSQWQLAAHAGTDLRLARGYLEEDLNALSVAAHGYQGVLKVQVVGPLTLAAAVAQPRGEAASSDPGLRRDLAASLAEGLAAHVASVQSRLPGAELVVQVDEPSLPAVLSGALPTRSGWARLAAVEVDEAAGLLRTVLASAPADTLVHCCAPGVPWSTLRDTGTCGVGFDLDLASDADLDEMGAIIDAGGTLWIGVVPTSAPAAQPLSSAELARRARHLWQRLGFSADVMRERTVLVPACGLAGWDPAQAVATYRALQEAVTRLSEDDSAPTQVASTRD